MYTTAELTQHAQRERERERGRERERKQGEREKTRKSCKYAPCARAQTQTRRTHRAQFSHFIAHWCAASRRARHRVSIARVQAAAVILLALLILITNVMQLRRQQCGQTCAHAAPAARPAMRDPRALHVRPLLSHFFPPAATTVVVLPAVFFNGGFESSTGVTSCAGRVRARTRQTRARAAEKHNGA